MAIIAKQCPHCTKMSYSATDREEWICPYCNQDITHIPVQPALGTEDKKPDLEAR